MNEAKQRGLDAWIAEHVMGWNHAPKCYQSKNAIAFSTGDERGILYCGKERLPVPHECDHPENEMFYPTTTPGSAMQVLERCAELKQETIKIWMTSSFEWCVSGGLGHHACANTLPLALCLFAQKLFTK